MYIKTDPYFFPFDELRYGQKKFIFAINDALENKKDLLVHAPTGIGKTAASIASCLKFAIEKDKKLFFLTTRNTHHRIAIETLCLIKKKKQLNNLVVLDLVGKKHLCKQTGLGLFGDNFNYHCSLLKKTKQCLFYKNTYNNMHELTQDAKIFTNKLLENIYSSQEVKEMCNAFCPYEIQTSVAKYANVIIADYFHLFDKDVFDSCFGKSGIKKQDIILIADEAHNLNSRIKSIYSIKFSSKFLKNIIEICLKLKDNYLANIFEKLYFALLTEADLMQKANRNTCEFKINKGFLINIIENTAGCDICEFKILVEKLGQLEMQKNENSQYLINFAEFIDKWKIDADGFLYYAVLEKNKEMFFEYKKECIDPGLFAKDIFSKIYCSILMSATLTPFDMHISTLGMNKDNCACLKLKSPFPKKNRTIIIANNITTKYAERNNKLYQTIADYIMSIKKSTNGNIAVFFPSYEFMNNCLYYIENLEERNFCLLTEQQNMTKHQKEHIYNLFKKSSYIHPFSILAAVVGANFSEGVDFPGDIVKAVCVVGIPFEKKTIETDATIDYYNKKFNYNGWNYAYIFPAINRTIQAAGRCIRSEKDIGAIILLDNRYLMSKYRTLLPKDWDDANIVSSNYKIEEHLKKFFRR